MFFGAQESVLKAAQNEAAKIVDETQIKPKILSKKNLVTFGNELKYAFKLMLEEKEILFFAVLQW
jgi:hypothetical protein